jgi:NADP-dependent 3-hydroxy acid dehydrogenase YdfG
MSEPLSGVTAVVTGASSGIGAATARALAAAGASVALLARRADRLAALAGALGQRATAHPVDVTDYDTVRATIDRIAETSGIDIVVCNAGHMSAAPVTESDFADWRTMVDVNVLGVFAAVHAAAPHLIKAAQGSRGVADLITVSSVAGRKISAGNTVYAATKHAVGAFTEGIRLQLGERHVRVGVVEPGLVRTELTEATGRGTPDIPDSDMAVLEPEDIADAIVFAVTRPARMAINELLTRPVEQYR